MRSHELFPADAGFTHIARLAAGLLTALALASPVSAQDSVGKRTYDTACAVCHAAGVAGAPKLLELA